MLAEKWMLVGESKLVELRLLRTLTRVSRSKPPELIERRIRERQAIEFETWGEKLPINCSVHPHPNPLPARERGLAPSPAPPLLAGEVGWGFRNFR